MSPHCTKPPSCDYFAEFPVEIIDLVLEYLSKRDIISLRSTCRSYNGYFTQQLIHFIAAESTAETLFDYLQRAIKSCLHQIITLLLAEQQELAKMENKLKETALHTAANHKCTFGAQKLVNADANLEAVTRYGWTPLMEASRFGHVGIVKILIDAGASVNYQGFHGWTALHLAIRSGHSTVAEALLKAGANPNLRDHDRSFSGCGKVKAWGAVYFYSLSEHHL